MKSGKQKHFQLSLKSLESIFQENFIDQKCCMCKFLPYAHFHCRLSWNFPRNWGGTKKNERGVLRRMFRSFPLLLDNIFLPSKNKWKFGWKTLQFSFRFSMSRVACASHWLSTGISNRLRFSNLCAPRGEWKQQKTHFSLRVWKWKFSIENEGEISSFQHRMFFDFNFKVVDFLLFANVLVRRK